MMHSANKMQQIPAWQLFLTTSKNHIIIIIIILLLIIIIIILLQLIIIIIIILLLIIIIITITINKSVQATLWVFPCALNIHFPSLACNTPPHPPPHPQNTKIILYQRSVRDSFNVNVLFIFITITILKCGQYSFQIHSLAPAKKEKARKAKSVDAKKAAKKTSKNATPDLPLLDRTCDLT